MRPFNKGIQKSIVHVLTKPLPAKAPGFQQVHFFAGTNRLERFPVQFNAIHGKFITAPVIHIELSVIIGKKRRIPSANIKGVHQWFPVIGLGIGTHPHGELTRIGGTKHNHRIPDNPHARCTEFIIAFIPGPQKFF